LECGNSFAAFAFGFFSAQGTPVWGDTGSGCCLAHKYESGKGIAALQSARLRRKCILAPLAYFV
jgi:hypothetical protein